MPSEPPLREMRLENGTGSLGIERPRMPALVYAR
jgi:hypothetical protein